MNIAVFGANGGTGRLLVRQAVEAGQVVTAVTRHPETFPTEHENLRVVEGDVYDITDVERAIENADAVISTLGVPYGRKPITIYSEGTGNLVSAMRSAASCSSEC
jgi:putative NADH-flavin reductase